MRKHKHVFLFWQSAWVKQEIFCAARSSSSFFHLLICNLKTQSCIRQKSACITSSLVTLILTIHFFFDVWNDIISVLNLVFYLPSICFSWDCKTVFILSNKKKLAVYIYYISIYSSIFNEIYRSCQSCIIQAKRLFKWK